MRAQTRGRIRRSCESYSDQPCRKFSSRRDTFTLLYGVCQNSSLIPMHCIHTVFGLRLGEQAFGDCLKTLQPTKIVARTRPHPAPLPKGEGTIKRSQRAPSPSG